MILPTLRALALLGHSAGKGAMFSVQFTAKTLRSLKVWLELPARTRAISRMVPFVSAHQTYLGAVTRVPAGPKWATYRNQLKLVRVGSAKAKIPTFAVYGEPKAGVNRSFDTAVSVMYIRPKKNFMGKVRKEVLILAKYSPWTAETLPFSPQKNDAVTVIRKVNKREVQAITKAREKDRPEWHKLLTECGVRNVNQTKKLPELKTQVVQDLAFDALRLEFGYGGAKASPHWRPGVKEGLQFTKRLLKRRGIFTKALTDPRDRSWKRWPPRVESSIKIDTLKSISKFSKRLRIRV